MTLATTLGTASGLVQLVAFFLYIRTLRRGQTRPNGMSWLMWAYGSMVPFYIEGDTGAPLPVLLAPILCALLSMYVAARAFLHGPSVPAAPHDWLVLALDLAILGGYLAFASAILPGEGLETAFLLLPAASSVLSFWPILRSTCLDPAGERPLAWFVWSVSYGLMAFAVMAAELPWPYLAYPVITQAMNLLVGLLAMGGAETQRTGRPTTA